MTDILCLSPGRCGTAFGCPAALIPNVAISVFFLFVFNSGLSSVAGSSRFQGLLPGLHHPSVHRLSFGGRRRYGGPGAGARHRVGILHQAAPDPHFSAVRWSGGLWWRAPCLLVGQVILILLLGLALGLKAAAGAGGLIMVLLFAFLWGMAFAGYAVFVALKTKNGAAAEAATFAFFPLIFLSTTFVPKAVHRGHLVEVGGHREPHHLHLRRHALVADRWVGGPASPHRARGDTGLCHSHRGLALRQARRATQLG